MAERAVSITLTSVRAQESLTTRKFELTISNPSIIIRRSSSKGNVASARGAPSASNALFDCPVVSRRHAELFIDGPSVIIQDLGSLHGTSVNGVKKPSQEPIKLRSGDVISIGNSVADGSRNYYATIFRIDFAEASIKNRYHVDLSTDTPRIQPKKPIQPITKPTGPTTVMSEAQIVWQPVKMPSRITSYTVPESDSDDSDIRSFHPHEGSTIAKDATRAVTSGNTTAQALNARLRSPSYSPPPLKDVARFPSASVYSDYDSEGEEDVSLPRAVSKTADVVHHDSSEPEDEDDPPIIFTPELADPEDSESSPLSKTDGIEKPKSKQVEVDEGISDEESDVAEDHEADRAKAIEDPVESFLRGFSEPPATSEPQAAQQYYALPPNVHAPMLPAPKPMIGRNPLFDHPYGPSPAAHPYGFNPPPPPPPPIFGSSTYHPFAPVNGMAEGALPWNPMGYSNHDSNLDWNFWADPPPPKHTRPVDTGNPRTGLFTGTKRASMDSKNAAAPSVNPMSRVSIPNIISKPSEEPDAVAGTKRKAPTGDAFSSAAKEVIDMTNNVIETGERATKLPATGTAIVGTAPVEERVAKKSRVQVDEQSKTVSAMPVTRRPAPKRPYRFAPSASTVATASTFAVGAVVGGVAMLGGLLALPDSMFV